ncbi:MAG: sodium:solute symporter, partial [Candidatus Eisenbacteria bacterium]
QPAAGPDAMSALDWGVLFATLAFFVGWGLWRARGERDLTDYLLAGRSVPWYGVLLSIMATQASAITFLSTPGQGFADGLRFVQFYFGLPFAMIVIAVTAVPIYQRLKVFTAYEFLQTRFDSKTRTLAAALFLTQRGLAAGLTIYAPSLVLSVILGWPVGSTSLVLGGLAVIYTAWGGSRSVGQSHMLQFTIIMATMAVAFLLVLRALPDGVGAGEAVDLAGAFGRLNAINTHFDPNDRYNLWSGLIGGFFLQLSYFGTDQSQVGRYLTGRSVRETRMGLLFNGLLKIPMQYFILSLGVLLFVFYLFVPSPAFFNPGVVKQLESGPRAVEYRAIDAQHRAAQAERARHARDLVRARQASDGVAREAALRGMTAAQADLAKIRERTVALIKADAPKAPTNDTNYVFLSFVLAHLPAGLIGLVFAAVFAASMNSTSSELNALASTTVVDVVKRIAPGSCEGMRGVWISRFVTLGWAAFAVAFAENASRLGSLIEAVNILGSLFYGTILGIFLTAFYLKWVGGTAVFFAALIAEVVVLLCFRFTPISFLWYNLIGCAVVVIVALMLQAAGVGRPRAPATGAKPAPAA